MAKKAQWAVTVAGKRQGLCSTCAANLRLRMPALIRGIDVAIELEPQHKGPCTHCKGMERLLATCDMWDALQDA